jgi:nuclear receptor subfamily 0 group A
MLGQSAQHLDPRLHHQLAAAMSHHQALQGRTKEDLLLLGLDEYKNSTSPSISSPESHNSDTSVEVSESRLLTGAGLFLNNNTTTTTTKGSPEQRPSSNSKDMFMPLPFASLTSLAPTFPHSAAFFPPSAAASQHSTFLFPPSSFLYHQQPPRSHQSVLKNNNNRYTHNNNGDVYSKRFFLDAILRSQQTPNGGTASRDDDEEEEDEDEDEDEDDTLTEEMTSPKHQSGLAYSTDKRSILSMSPQHNDPEQENPMDLSMKGCNRCQNTDRLSPSAGSVDGDLSDQEEERNGGVSVKDSEHDAEYESMASDHKERHSRSAAAAPMDLTTRA